MSFKTQLVTKTKQFESAQKREAQQTSLLATDLGVDLSKLSDELLKKVCPTAVGYAATIVRKQAVENVKKGGGETLGMSRKTKTRGVFRNGKMVNVGKGAWSKKILEKRGANNRSLADPGGIIKKNISRKQGGIVASQIVGPRYEKGPRGKNFAHTHEPLAGASTGAPNHKWWGQPAKRALRPRPFLGPAGRSTIVQQQSAMKKALMKWKIDPSEVGG
jgi:hypothetical protein